MTTRTSKKTMKTREPNTSSLTSSFFPTRGGRASSSSSSMRTKAIDPQVALAVAQQNLSLALVLGAEGVLNSQRMPSDFIGRPDLPKLAPGIAGCAAAFALINSDNDVVTPIGLAIGALACLYVIKIEFDRLNETKDDPLDWPGPKVFPGGLLVFGLLQFLTNAQGFVREM
jgi:hypothetical protein